LYELPLVINRQRLGKRIFNRLKSGLFYIAIRGGVYNFRCAVAAIFRTRRSGNPT
jgi:hypothetical protein